MPSIVIVEDKADEEWAKAAGTAITARAYVGNPDASAPRGARIVNLSADLDYLDFGYYCSLLAEARGHKVIPSVETIIALSRRELYGLELPDLEAALRADIDKKATPPRGAFTLTVYFGQCREAGFNAFARQAFDRFRCPILRIKVGRDGRWKIRALDVISPSSLSPEEFDFFLTRLEHYTRADWRAPKQKVQTRYAMAILQDPQEKLPPSTPETLKKFQQIGRQIGIDVELIERKDYLRLAEFDALFIRETTSIQNHTFRFANKAVYEGIPVIDHPTSMLRCTNKVYLAELLAANRLSAPRTMILDRDSVMQAESLGYPVVLKIPDGSFSRGVVKAEDRAQLVDHAKKLLKHSSVILAQQFMYTEFDWRVGVLNRQPLFVTQYFMSRKHWQIVEHQPDGGFKEGKWQTHAIDQAPKEVVELALNAANLIGDGLYGVDVKQNAEGIFVIEINDNPSIERGVEDGVLKDDLYLTILRDFVRRIEAK